MKKILTILAVVAFLVFGLTAGVSAGAMGLTRDIEDTGAWIGKDVINPEGEVLGDIENFVRDESGTIVLAIVSFDEKNVAVPYTALSFDENEDHVVLIATMDQLANAPEIESYENLTDHSSVDTVYRYFGERPFWGDEAGGADLDTHDYLRPEEGVNEGFDSDRETDTQGGASLDYSPESDYIY